MNSRTKPSKPFRIGLPNVTDLRSPIIAWNSMAAARTVVRRKEPAGEKVKGWNLAVELNQNRPTSSREKVILIGNPNVGKSVIFNYLTGKYVTVSNYPGTTVEVSTGTLSAHGKKFQVLDTPGVNSLIPMSEDEKVTRDILLKEPKSHLIQVMDAKNIRRGLLISLQLLEMGLPFLVLLNMWDEAKSRGIEIQTPDLIRDLRNPDPENSGHETKRSGEDQRKS